MGNFVEVKYNDIKNLSNNLNSVIKSNVVDDIFKRVSLEAMFNTIEEAEKRTPVWSGELKKSWRDNVDAPDKQGNKWVTKAVNEAYNERAAAVGKDPYYAEFVEKGHKKVPWRKNTYGVHMLAEAEEDTLRKLPDIIENEMKKLLGGLFD